jgi:hypothetical protein
VGKENVMIRLASLLVLGVIAVGALAGCRAEVDVDPHERTSLSP